MKIIKLRTNSIKMISMAMILTFETIFAGLMPVSATTVSENDVIPEEIVVSSNTVMEECEVPLSDAGEASPERVTPVSGTDGKIDWSIDENGHLTIIGIGDYEGDADWRDHADSIKTASVYVQGITDTGGMFYGCYNLESVDLSKLDTSRVTDMSRMFYGCKNLESLNLSNFDTSKVTDMSYMFYNCNKLTTLDISSFDTGKVKYMQSMFRSCKKVPKLDVGKFDTSNVERMHYMFYECVNVTELDVSNFDTKNVTDMSNMFYECYEVKTLDVSNFDTGKVTDMQYMFGNCNDLLSLDVSNFNTSNVTNMYYMFGSCEKVERLDVSNFDTGNVTNMTSMFSACKGLVMLDVSAFDFSKTTSADGFVKNTKALKKIIFPSLPMEIELDESWVDENEVSVTAAKANLGRAASYYRESYLEDECYKNGHKYMAPVFTWNGVTSATAYFKCTVEGCKVENEKTVKAVITEKTTPATTEKEGNIAYTATVVVQGKTYTDVKNVTIPKLEKENESNSSQDKPTSKPVSKPVGTVFKYSGANYKVTKASAKSPTVEYVALLSNKVKKASVPTTIKVSGVTYKVTSIAKNAFKNKKKLTTVTIGKNVTKIGAKAFYGCKKLKKIVIKSTKLKSVGKQAIKGINKRATIDVPNSKKKKYKKLFKAKTGFKKTMKIK